MRTINAIRTLSLALTILFLSTLSSAQIGISISFGPPALPVYEQPYLPDDGYMWTPGYWAYDEGDYYWVPGTWVQPPQVGYLWTPGYWAWENDGYRFNQGYWGEHVGFYGGINYGYGYSGEGYEGGRWDHDHFFYNRAANNVNVTNIHNVYNTTIINNNTTINRVSYNGGNGGVNSRPRQEDEVAARERHAPPVAVQAQNVQAARSNPELRASANQGRPPIAATPRAGDFRDHGVVAAKEAGAPYKSPANRDAGRPSGNASAPRPENASPSRPENASPSRPDNSAPARPDNANPSRPDNSNLARPDNNIPRPPTAVHPRDLPAHTPPPAAEGAQVDQRRQQQQEKLDARQNQDHQKLQQRQDQEHQRMTQQNAPAERQQQVEQKHQQQTQQLEQKHTQQEQKVRGNSKQENRNQPPPNRDKQ